MVGGPATYSEEFAETGVVGFAGLALCVFDILGEPETNDFEHSVERFVGGANCDKGIRGVEVGPVFEVGGWLEKLGGKREANGGKIRDANESVAKQDVCISRLW